MNQITDKIKPLKELSSRLKTEKAKGKKVVLCHGCFDLLHIGHIKHFNAAKEMGDILVVTLTPDRFIEKGPGRPLFNEDLRLEQVANLACVDFVALNGQKDAVDAIESIQPDIYVKGDEYQSVDKDPTGKMTIEKKAVEDGGGELRFTSLPTFSSTELINRSVDRFSPEIQTYLSRVRGQFSADRMATYVEDFSKLKVLVIGDIIVDEYSYCHVSGTVSKYPTLAAVFDQTIQMLGGSAAVARHVRGFVQDVTLLSWVGDQNDYESYIRKGMAAENIALDLMAWPRQPTVVKRRFITGEYPNPLSSTGNASPTGARLFELGYLPKLPMAAELKEAMAAKVKALVDKFDMVIVADFGHGTLSQPVADALKGRRWFAVNSQTNSSNFGFNLINRYKNLDFVCIDELEARLPYGDRQAPVDEIARRLKADLAIKTLMVTMGKNGLVIFGDEPVRVPPLATRVLDTVGSGDAVLSLASLSNFLKQPSEVTGFLGACAGAGACQIPGNMDSVKKASLSKFLTGLLK